MNNDHQPTIIPTFTGYRVTSQLEHDLIEEARAVGEKLQELLQKVRDLHTNDVTTFDHKNATDHERRVHSYRVAEGQNYSIRAAEEFQIGMMLLERAVVRPTSFAINFKKD